MNTFTIHESAIVDVGARVGEGTRIWQWAHYGEQVPLPPQGEDQYAYSYSGSEYRLLANQLESTKQ